MRSDTVTKGKQQAPHRSLFNALGLTEEEMKQMAGLNKNVRYYYPDEEKLAAYANMKIDLDSQK